MIIKQRRMIKILISILWKYLKQRTSLTQDPLPSPPLWSPHFCLSSFHFYHPRIPSASPWDTSHSLFLASWALFQLRGCWGSATRGSTLNGASRSRYGSACKGIEGLCGALSASCVLWGAWMQHGANDQAMSRRWARRTGSRTCPWRGHSPFSL